MKNVIKKIIKYVKNPINIIIFLESKNIIKTSDEKFLKLKFKTVFKKELDLNNPTTFNEKMQWLKINDRKEIYTKMVDKLEAKSYVANAVGDKYTIKTIGVYDNFDKIKFNELPNKFVIKCTHDSGGLIICKDKSKLNKYKARKKINRCLKCDFFYKGREWPYKNVKPQIIIEEYIEDEENKELIDYKFMCFNGKVKCCLVCRNRWKKTGVEMNFYDVEWKRMPFKREYRNFKENIQKPKKYDEMIKLAEILSEDTKFLRVDFYQVRDKIFFGELTFYPASGFGKFVPEEYDTILGNWLKLY